MNKSIELTASQIKAYENGARVFLFAIKDIYIYSARSHMDYREKDAIRGSVTTLEDFIKKFSPIQKGDKDIFIKEEFEFIVGPIENYYIYKSDYTLGDLKQMSITWQPASKMTKEQSRYSFKECIDVRIVRVREIEQWEAIKISGSSIIEPEDFEVFHNNQMQEQNINRTYEDNDYVFLAELSQI